MEQTHPPIAAFEQYIKGLLAHAPASKISFLSQALRIEPSFHRVRIELWNAFTDLSEHPQALAAVRDVPSTHRLARQASFPRRLDVAPRQYEPALRAFTSLNAARSDPAILNNIGIVQLRRPGSGAGKSVAYFRDATLADNTDADLFFNLGYAYWLQKDLTNAAYWLRERSGAIRRTTRRITCSGWRSRPAGVSAKRSGRRNWRSSCPRTMPSGMPSRPART